MNYIKQLQSDLAKKEAALKVLEESITLFRKHLASSKFHNDTTIQVSDVNRWLDCIQTNVNQEIY